MADLDILKMILDQPSNNDNVRNVTSDNPMENVLEHMSNMTNITQEQIENFKKILTGDFTTSQSSFFSDYFALIFIIVICLIIVIFGYGCYKLYKYRKAREHRRIMKRKEKEMRKIK